RLAGLLIGFAGVVLLMSRDLGAGAIARGIWGQVAVLAASLSYAVAATFSRRHLRGHPPLLQATMVVLFADLFAWLTVFAGERPGRLPALPVTWFGLIYGALALQAGIPPGAALAMSSIVLAGSAQFVGTQLFAAGAPGALIILTTFIVNLRHMLYSASVAPYLSRLGLRWKMLLAY